MVASSTTSFISGGLSTVVAWIIGIGLAFFVGQYVISMFRDFLADSREAKYYGLTLPQYRIAMKRRAGVDMAARRKKFLAGGHVEFGDIEDIDDFDDDMR